MLKKQRLAVSFALCLTFLNACSTQVIQPSDQPQPLQAATTSITRQLFAGIHANQGLWGQLLPKSMALDVMVDAYSQEQLLLNKQVTQYIQQTAKAYTDEPILPLSRESLRDSNYVLQSSIALEQHPNPTLGKLYHQQGIIRKAQDGTVIARADAWITDKNLNYQRYPEFKDSPSYTLQKSPHPTTIVPHQRQGFATLALLNEAGEAYAKQQYSKAIRLYQAAAQHADGLTPRTYAGLYISHLRLGQNDQSEQAFDKLLALSFTQNKELALKILFKVGTEQFAGNPMTQEQYTLWVDKIAAYLDAQPKCIGVTGHGSHSGSAAFNNALSLRRANHVRDMMKTAFPATASKIRTAGKGFSENIVGTGSDDERDALDRRIEFTLPACKR